MRACSVTGVKSMKGHKRSHSLHATNKTWKANLQKVTMLDENGNEIRVYVSARALKRGVKRGTIKRV